MNVCKLTSIILRTKTFAYLPCLSQFPSAGYCHCDRGWRFMSEDRTQSQKSDNRRTGKELDVAREGPYAGLTTAQKVKEAGKDATYTGVIVLGVGVTGLMAYAIGRELLSKESPSGVYGQALKICQNHDELLDALGFPVKGYGETTRRGRRRYVSHHEYVVDGVKHMRMKFYVEGAHKKGTAHLEVKKNDRGKYEFRYLFVDTDSYPHRTIILEDHR
ncbi:hypothetical protein ScPMuIL_001796 [Solemya velum]